MGVGLIMTRALFKGARVQTPLGRGTVAYIRMGPPRYDTPEGVSVVLDDHPPGYVGTMFKPEDLSPEEES